MKIGIRILLDILSQDTMKQHVDKSSIIKNKFCIPIIRHSSNGVCVFEGSRS